MVEISGTETNKLATNIVRPILVELDGGMGCIEPSRCHTTRYGAMAGSGVLVELAEATPAFVLSPQHIIVAWSGVLVLAYAPFPDAALGLKERLSDAVPGLPRESPGSSWPKTTLAALADDATLSEAQLEALTEAGAAAAEALAELKLEVTELAAVTYGNRALAPEARLASLRMPLGRGEAADGTDAMMVCSDEAHAAHVASVVAEATAPAAEYLDNASRAGNRASHYTGSAVGATLVADVAAMGPPDAVSVLLAIIDAFRDEVDAAMPDAYTWMPTEALHVTLRGLAP